LEGPDLACISGKEAGVKRTILRFGAENGAVIIVIIVAGDFRPGGACGVSGIVRTW